MNLVELEIPGCFEIQNFKMLDDRGVFIKTFNKDEFESNNLNVSFRESFYSKSNKGVIRGMHFQLPPFDHEKLIYVTQGIIMDVLVDLRKSSSTYGKHIKIELKELDKSIYIPKGIAHGFQSLSEESTVIYNVTTVHNKEYDSGIRWDSFGMNWPLAASEISSRDMGFISLNQFKSPF